MNIAKCHINLNRVTSDWISLGWAFRAMPFVVPDRDKPSYFQNLINPFWKRGAK